jgi:hypothetical protein
LEQLIELAQRLRSGTEDERLTVVVSQLESMRDESDSGEADTSEEDPVVDDGENDEDTSAPPADDAAPGRSTSDEDAAHTGKRTPGKAGRRAPTGYMLTKEGKPTWLL